MLNTSEDSNSTLHYNNIDCIFCGTEFSKNNKPLVLKCSHNICQSCHSLNKSKVLCLICKSKFEGKDARRFPINFLLLEVIERSQGKEDKKAIPKKRKKSFKGAGSEQTHHDHNTPNKEVFHCLQCDLFFPNNKFHAQVFPSHELKEESSHERAEGKESLMRKSRELMSKYKNFNEKLEEAHQAFFNHLNKTFTENIKSVVKELENNDPLDNLMIIGLINKSDKERIKEHFEKYMKNEKILNLFTQSNSFEELINNLSQCKDIKENKIHQFLSSYFFMQEIFDKKLNPNTIEEKLSRFSKDNLVNSEEIKTLYHSFSHDVNVEVYNALGLERDINKNIKLPFLLTKSNQDLIVFDPMTESIKSFSSIKKFFPSEFASIENFSYFVSSDYTLYITGGVIGEGDNLTIANCFSINLNNNEVKKFNNMTEPRHSHSSIVINNKLYVLGGSDSAGSKKSFERLNLNDNTWLKLQSSSHEFRNKPTLLNFEDEYIYIFDDIFSFFYYELKTDKWTICKPYYRGSYNLKLKNFTTMVYDSNVIILGGVNEEGNENNQNIDAKYQFQLNNNIYHLKDVGSVIKIKGEFKVSDVSSLIDHGFMVDNHYLLEYSEISKNVKVFYSKDLSNYKWDLIIANKEQN